MPAPPPSSVACPKCGVSIVLPSSANVRFATCPNPECRAEYDKAKLATLAPSALPPAAEPPVEVADTRAKAPSQRTCSDPECGTHTDKSTCPKCGSPTLIDAAFVHDPLIGRVLNESFEVVERLGGGGFGTVYRARQLRMKRDVALKVVRAEWRGDLEMARRFVREAQLVSRLEHPSTIRVYEFGQTDDGVLFLAMELLRGETLTARLARLRRFPPAEAVRIMACVARSLDEAHAHGIVHRDLKPDNVVLHQPVRGEEVVKVLDFGIAKVTQERTSLFQTGSLRTLGTPLYMAPEQIRSEEVDGRTDLYALGVMLHELLSGRPPFDAVSPAEVMHLHQTAAPPKLGADVPEALRSLCVRLLAKRREDRPASADVVVKALDAALVARSEPAPEPVRPAPPGPKLVPRPEPVPEPNREPAPAPRPPEPERRPEPRPPAPRPEPRPPPVVRETELVRPAPRPPPPRPAPEPEPPRRSSGHGWVVAAVVLVAGGVGLAAAWDNFGPGKEAVKAPAAPMPVAAKPMPARPAEPHEPKVVTDDEPAAEKPSGNPPTSGPSGFVRIEPGTFTMGSPTSEEGRFISEVQHSVTITRPFWLGAHEVTQAEWSEVMGSNPSSHKDCAGCPVENVSWDDAAAFGNKRSAKEGLEACYSGSTFKGLTCTGYRLPTEAEWEYAARAGTTGARHGELDAVAWHSGNSSSQSHPVGQQTANDWGLYDMLGNVYEWCGDGYGEYPTGSATDPLGPSGFLSRVYRGGSWRSVAGYVRAAGRDGDHHGYRIGYLGLRLARSIP